MAVIAVYSVKGGVGKTTIAANLAWLSASISLRQTLLWDLDAAGGAGFLYGLAPEQREKAGALFTRDADPQKLIRKTGFDRLDLLPADESLRQIDSLLAQIGKKRRLAKLTEDLSRRYERIILDCPPVMSELSAQVVRAADVVIVPLPPSPLSTRAFAIVADEIRRHAKVQPPILPVFSMLDRRRTLHRDALAANPAWPIIPLASAVEQCATRQQPLGQFAPSSAAATGFRQLWTAIERKLAKANA